MAINGQNRRNTAFLRDKHVDWQLQLWYFIIFALIIVYNGKHILTEEDDHIYPADTTTLSGTMIRHYVITDYFD